MQDSNLTVRHIGTAQRKIVGSPDYLRRFGTPQSIDDLDRHKCLGFNFRRSAPVWPLQEKGRIADRIVLGPLLANNGETVRHLTLQGAGLARLGDYHVRNDIKAGRLVDVLAHADAQDEEEIHALYLGSKQTPQRVRVFLDFVIPRLQAYMRA